MELIVLIHLIGIVVAAALGLGYYKYLPESRKRPDSEKRILASSLLSWVMVCIAAVFIVEEIHIKITREINNNRGCK